MTNSSSMLGLPRWLSGRIRPLSAGTCPMGAIFCEVSYRGSFKDSGQWQIGSAAEVRGASARPLGSHTRV
jgi:hypothetical protein